MGLEFLI